MSDTSDRPLELDMLSAYLDGELTADERRAVEARLTESAEWREELAEVQSARAIVRALVPREAPPGFWDRVLTHVEAVAAEDESAAPVLPAPVPIGAAREHRTRAKRRGARVGWLVGAAAAVAALVVVVVLPSRNAVRPNVTAAATQHGASAAGTGGAIGGLAPVLPLARSSR
jgi:anti-sigma factor RsiW